MPSCARKDIVPNGEVGVYHCVNRCVRRAWLCGHDPVTGSCYDHRKQWIEDRLEELAGSFAVDVCGFSAMSNHVHVVLRTRPDVAEAWSDEEVARRWWRLFPKRRDEEGEPAEPGSPGVEQRVLAPGSRGLLADPRLDGPASAERQTRVDPSRAAADSGTAGGPRRIVGRLRAELRPLVPSRGRQRATLGRRGGPGGPAMVSRHQSLPASVRVTRQGQITTARDWQAISGSSGPISSFGTPAPGHCRLSHRPNRSPLTVVSPQTSPRS